MDVLRLVLTPLFRWKSPVTTILSLMDLRLVTITQNIQATLAYIHSARSDVVSCIIQLLLLSR